MTDEQLLDMFRFLERASHNLHSLINYQERIAKIGILCSIVLYSVNRRSNT